jgi:hypothetical protein
MQDTRNVLFVLVAGAGFFIAMHQWVTYAPRAGLTAPQPTLTNDAQSDGDADRRPGAIQLWHSGRVRSYLHACRRSAGAMDVRAIGDPDQRHRLAISDQPMTTITCTATDRLGATASTTVDATTSTPSITIDQVIADIQNNPANEVVPLNTTYGWSYHAATQIYNPGSGNNCSLSWFVALEGTGNAATNTRVEIRNLRHFILSQATRQWGQVSAVQRPYTDRYQLPKWNISGPVGERNESDGGLSFKPAYPFFYHGYGVKAAISGVDVRGVYVSIEFRIIKDDPNGVDDTAQAVYAIEAGADYYYTVNTSPSSYPNGSVPAAGNGRVLKGTTNWRKATLLVPNFSYGASYDEFRSNPPPL